MICLICREAELIQGLISVPLERGELRFEVTGVPAWICPHCGEAVLEEHVVLQLWEHAIQMAAQGLRQSAAAYSDLPD